MTTSHLNLSLQSKIQVCEAETAPDIEASIPEPCSPTTQICDEGLDSYQGSLGQRELETPFPRSPSMFAPTASIKALPPSETEMPLADASESWPFWQKALLTGGAVLALPYVIGAASVLGLLTAISGCGGNSEDGVTRPATSDADQCEAHRHEIESYKPDAKYQAMIDATEFPTLDFSSAGQNVVDSEHRPIKSFKPTKSDIVDYVAMDNKLFILTRNKVSGGFAPATILIYQINSTKLIPVAPNQALVLYPLYNPVWMAPSGTQQLHVLFGPPSSDLIVSLDAKAVKVIDGNWCDPKLGNGGSAGAGGAAGHSGTGGTAGHGGTGGTAGIAGQGGSSGNAGHGGSAGTAGKGGSSGNAGHGGSSGTAGHGGSSGSAGKGGSAGTAGKGGTGGNAGTAGHAGTAGTAGKGGSSGNAGKGGTGGVK